MASMEPVPENALALARSRALLARNWGNVQASLLAFITASAPQFSDAEDLLQEVAVEVAMRFDEYDPGRPFLPWALWIAKIKIADFYRVRQRRQVILMGESMNALAEACVTAHEKLSDEQLAIEKCLSKLTDRSREMLNLRYSEGMSSPEIGARLGMSVRYVRVALSRIRTALTDCAQAVVEPRSASNA
ncbi:sigma-70 family RNA polymerase sigma factor [Planctomicrobium sp. SH664]|uniref:sigma-70 family RNA polymerase sigma factor n=1 Tax=Planctomicrobium sp. SH664 TaxID=3448125 RepID=UPI003F5B34D0